jgi:protein-L-isoaspartate(D-aspartate) O-methyltransferase
MPASSTSQPSLVAQMLELLDLTSGLRVLEIGAGTGYNAALMAELVGDQRLVVTVDVLDDVVAQTRRLLTRAGYPGLRCCCATASRVCLSGRRSTGSWPRWAARTCHRSGPSS